MRNITLKTNGLEITGAENVIQEIAADLGCESSAEKTADTSDTPVSVEIKRLNIKNAGTNIEIVGTKESLENLVSCVNRKADTSGRILSILASNVESTLQLMQLEEELEGELEEEMSKDEMYSL